MTNLQALCDLPIELEDSENDFRIHFDDCVRCLHKRTVSLQSLSPALLNRSIKYPETVYEEYTVCLNGDQSVFENNLKYDLLIIPPGLLGIEFIKSHIFYTPESHIRNRLRFSSVVEAINATTTILMQKIIPNFEEEDQPTIEEGILIELKAGEKFAIPEGYYYTFINASEEPIILSRLYKNYNIADYTQDERTYTMAYFCIRKNARQELVYNPKFRKIPSIKKINPRANHFPIIGFEEHVPLYRLAKIKTEMFCQLLK